MRWCGVHDLARMRLGVLKFGCELERMRLLISTLEAMPPASIARLSEQACVLCQDSRYLSVRRIVSHLIINQHGSESQRITWHILDSLASRARYTHATNHAIHAVRSRRDPAVSTSTRDACAVDADAPRRCAMFDVLNVAEFKSNAHHRTYRIRQYSH